MRLKDGKSAAATTTAAAAAAAAAAFCSYEPELELELERIDKGRGLDVTWGQAASGLCLLKPAPAQAWAKMKKNEKKKK